MPIEPKEFTIGLLATALLEDRYNKTGHIRDQARAITKRYESKLSGYFPQERTGSIPYEDIYCSLF